MNQAVASPWYRTFGAYRWMALALAAVLMATGFTAFTRDVAPDGSSRTGHSVGMP